ncbi:Translation factor pelota [Arthrobotrys musiformis]|uniref:Protein DOM34 homolog n=1 Tax=Arthrobotrys musiformis TaxID=47236 RepID=A0AAV9W6J3_9PEZI
MRLINQHIERDGSGTVTLYPEEPEDMWHAYNLIRIGDTLRASAVRRVVSETATGSTSSSRVHMNLTITVEKVDFDSQAGQLHTNGRVKDENKYVKVGAHHTLDLELNRNFTIGKAEWDSVSLGVVKEACDPAEKAEIGAVVLHEGLANICLITEHMTVLRQKIEVAIPRKRTGSVTAFEKSMDKFYDTIYQSILRHLPIENLKVILLASPGFLAESLQKYIFAEAVKTDNKTVMTAKPKFVTVHCSTGHVHALNEVLKSPAVIARLADTKYAKETKAMESFFKMMQTDEDRAWYGPKEVERAIEKGAVATLLVSNSLFRSNKMQERRRYVSMVEDVKASGAGEVMILSSIHESGVRLDGLGGVAAILLFPLQDLDESDEEGETDGGNEDNENL